MAKSGSILAFMAGAALGAAAVYLCCTDDGKKIVRKGKDKLEDYADDVLEKIEEARQAARKAGEQPEPEN